MSFPKLTFPLTVDFSETGYWIGEQGPFKYGEAVTSFFIGEDIAETPNDGTFGFAVIFDYSCVCRGL